MNFPTLARCGRVLLGFALVVTLTSIGVIRVAMAAPAVDAFYTGVTTDLAEFRLGTANDGLVVGSIELGPPAASFPAPCLDAGLVLLSEPISIGRDGLGAGAERAISDPVTGQARILRISGRIGDDGIATGSLSVSGVGPENNGITCDPRSFGWTALARTSLEAPRASAMYRGMATAGGTFAGLRSDGPVSFSVTADGLGLTNLTLAPLQECSATNLGSKVAPLEEGGASFAEEGRVSTAIPVVGRYRVAVSGITAVGAFYIDRSKAGCLPLAGTFTATGTGGTVPTGTGTPGPVGTTPPPSSASGFAGTPVYSPAPSRLAQAVFRGSLIELEIAMAGVEASGVWAQTAGGTFQLFVVGAPASVNAGFTGAFPGGFGTPTALTLVHRSRP